MRKIRKVIFLLLILMIQLIPVSNAAAGGTVSVDKTEVEQGSTFEVYVALNVISEAYDIKFNVNDSSLIEKTEVVNTIKDNKLSGNNRIYLVQIAEESSRTKYPVGTKIACMRYTIDDEAKVGSEIIISVSGDIVGENNSENTVNEEKKIKIVEKKEEPKTEKPEGKPKEETPEAEKPKIEDQNKKDDTIANKKHPNTGNKMIYLLSSIFTFTIITCFIYYKYKKNNF